MIFKHDDGTVTQITVAEYCELVELYGSDVEAEAEVDGKTEATTEFKVGDKVEVIGKSFLGRDEFIGKTAIIAKIYEDGDIEIDEGDHGGVYPPSSLELIEEEPEEVLSRDNVKVGEYLVITDKNNGSQFAIGGIIKAVAYYSSVAFTASNTDNTEHWNVRYTDVRRATDAEIAEATKPKEVKFEVGDVVSAGTRDRFATVVEGKDADGFYQLYYIKDGDTGYREPSEMRHATEEEKSHLQTLIGREKDEYKIGDLVELLSGDNSGYEEREGYIFEVDSGIPGYYHLKDNGNKPNNLETYIRPEELKLITPVEWRHDFVGGA